jgi:hypothetical protein
MFSSVTDRIRRLAPARRATRTFALIAAVGLVASACDVHGVSAPGTLARIAVTPNATIPALGTQQFTAIGYDADGQVITIAPSWSVAAGGGTVNQAGMFTAGSVAGVFTNTTVATVGGVSGSASVTVTIGPLASLTLTPNPVTLATGATQQFVAVGRDASGNIVPVAPTWAVVAGGGTIAQSGVFTAGGTSGTFTNTVQASSNGIQAFATVTVAVGPLATITVTPNPASLAAGATQQFTAVGRDATGNVVAIAPTWSIAAGGGTIDAAGVFTAGAATGTFTNTVKATSGTASGTATVIVTSGALTTITISPNPATVPVSGTQQFTAVGTDAGGNVVAITPTWAVVAGGGAISLTTGLFTAGNTAGAFPNTIRASVGGIAGFATVTVTSGALASITVSPNPAAVQTNGAVLFAAVGRDAGGNIVPVAVTWSVVNGGGTINAGTGLFTAGNIAASFANTVRATSGALSGSATVNVTSPPTLATITVTPNPASVVVNGTQQFVATGRDGNGNIFPIVPVWSVVAGGGSINPATGLFTAGAVAGTFNNTVVATVGATSGSATVNVTAVGPVLLINLGAAALNGIMAGTAVTCVSLGTIFADIAISPGLTNTGFPPCVVTGVKHLGDAVAAQGQIDLTNAYNTLAGLPCPPANFIVANLGGTTKAAGVYCSATSIGVTGTLVLDGGGNSNSTFVFQAGTSLITAGNVVLINGAQAKNVYWQVGSSATLGTASQFQGNILALTSITLVDNANLTGRALARNGAVTLGTGNTITLP